MVGWMKIKRKIYNLLVNSCDTVSYFFRHRIVFKKIINMSAKKLNQKLSPKPPPLLPPEATSKKGGGGKATELIFGDFPWCKCGIVELWNYQHRIQVPPMFLGFVFLIELK